VVGGIGRNSVMRGVIGAVLIVIGLAGHSPFAAWAGAVLVAWSALAGIARVWRRRMPGPDGQPGMAGPRRGTAGERQGDR
jgi:hypothetical protein